MKRSVVLETILVAGARSYAVAAQAPHGTSSAAVPGAMAGPAGNMKIAHDERSR